MACLVQVLFAPNERYFVNEKGSVRTAGTFPIRPESFGAIISDTLAHSGNSPERLRASIDTLEGLVRAVEAIWASSSTGQA